MIEIVALQGIGEVGPGEDLGALIERALAANRLEAREADILVVTSKIVSKAEDRFVRLDAVAASTEALALAERTLKDPRLVELVLQESSAIVRAAPHLLITRHRLGLVMANAGVDASNVGRAGHVLLLPRDPDASARRIRTALAARGRKLGVVISDSFGRPWRLGVVNVAIGAAGLPALLDRRGALDRDGRPLEVTQVGLADMIASAAGLASGEAAEGTPVVLLRGWAPSTGDANAASLIRPVEQDLFT